MRQQVNARFVLAAALVLCGCLVGYALGWLEIHRQGYSGLLSYDMDNLLLQDPFGWRFLNWRVMATNSMNGTIAGVFLTVLFLLSWRISGWLTPGRERRIYSFIGGWALGIVWLISMWELIPPALAHGGTLPFFCPDVNAFNTFLHRAFTLKLSDAPLLWSIAAGWLLVAQLIVGVIVRLTMRKGSTTTPVPVNKIWLIAVCCLIGLAAFVPQAGAIISRPTLHSHEPNILLISVDTLRPDRLGCYGGPAKTPNIDYLAEHGIRLDNALSASPWTLPSHAAMLTGNYPAYLGIHAVTDKVPADATLVSEYLLAKGFATAAFVSHLFVSQVYGFDQGFERFDYIASEQAADVARQAGEWIKAQNKRWFVLCHFFDPHWPYSLTDEADDDLRQTKDYARALRAALKDPALARDTWLPMYDKEIERVDRAIGQLIDILKTKNVLGNTAIILVADHGEAFGEYPREDGEEVFDPQQPGTFGHGVTCQPSVVRVPFIVYGTDLEKVDTQRQVSLLEVPALIAAIVKKSPYFTFAELSPAWTREDRRTEPLVVETSLGGKAQFGVYENGQFLLSPVDVSYLDLQLSLPARIKLNEGESGYWLNSKLNHFLDRYYKNSDEQVTLSPEEIKRLKQLGYIGATP